MPVGQQPMATGREGRPLKIFYQRALTYFAFGGQDTVNKVRF
jgi:hypothetical protein